MSKPYVLSYYPGDYEEFAAFDEALARYRELLPGNYAPSIHNSDLADIADDGGTDGLTDEQGELINNAIEEFNQRKVAGNG